MQSRAPSKCSSKYYPRNTTRPVYLSIYQTQGLWKFVAYGDVAAAMSALPRAGETLSGAWTRQDLLYESDTEALSVDPVCISKKDGEKCSAAAAPPPPSLPPSPPPSLPPFRCEGGGPLPRAV